jgi:hypothetical protein
MHMYLPEVEMRDGAIHAWFGPRDDPVLVLEPITARGPARLAGAEASRIATSYGCRASAYPTAHCEKFWDCALLGSSKWGGLGRASTPSPLSEPAGFRPTLTTLQTPRSDSATSHVASGCSRATRSRSRSASARVMAQG